MNRIEKTFRCSKDGRAVARIEVADQKRWFVRSAARDGHSQSLAVTMDEAAENWREGRKSVAKAFGVARYFKTLHRLRGPKVQWDEQRQEFPSELDLGLLNLDFEPMTWHGACPKCHTPYGFTTEIRPDGTYGVLMSRA